MNTKDYLTTRLSETFLLTEYRNPKRGDYGFWLYDELRRMNLAMGAKTERDAFVEALTYYQRRLDGAQTALTSLQERVDTFLAPFLDENERE